MTTYDRAQSRVNWVSQTQGGETKCETRKKTYAVDAELGQAVDAKIDAGCEQIIEQIALLPDEGGAGNIFARKDGIHTILRDAVPEEPKKTVNVKLTRITELIQSDGTVRKVTRSMRDRPQQTSGGGTRSRILVRRSHPRITRPIRAAGRLILARDLGHPESTFDFAA